jgi:hypothetical protein
MFVRATDPIVLAIVIKQARIKTEIKFRKADLTYLESRIMRPKP